MYSRKVTTQEELLEDLQRSNEFRKQQRLIRPFYRIAIDIIKRRNELGLTQRELAARAGTHQTRISKIKSNEIDIRLSTLIEIAEALECQTIISFVPFTKSIYTKSDEPYLKLFGIKTQLSNDIVPTKYYADGDDYQPVSVTEGQYDQCK